MNQFFKKDLFYLFSNIKMSNLENNSRKAEFVDFTLSHFTVHIIRQRESLSNYTCMAQMLQKNLN